MSGNDDPGKKGKKIFLFGGVAVREKLPRTAGVVCVVLVVVIYIFTFSVREGEGVLVETFGKVTRVLKSPEASGIHFSWPWPIQKIRRYDLRERVMAAPLNEVSTADNQLLVVQPFVLWRIEDPAAFREAVGAEVKRAEDLIAGPLLNGVNNVFARHAFREFVDTQGKGTTGPNVLSRMEEEITRTVAADVAQYGIAVAGVGFEQLVLPAEATKGVFEQMREAKERDAAQLENRGKAEADRIRAQARLAYERKIQEAETEAGKIVAAAHATAAGLLSGVKEKDLLLTIDAVNTLKELFADNTTIVFDPTTPPLDLLLKVKEAPGKAGEEESARPQEKKEGKRK